MKILSIILSLMAIILFISCGGSSEKKNLEGRLLEFHSILPHEIKEAFDKKKYSKTTFLIKNRLKNDSRFKSKFERFKSNEEIDVFTVEQVVDYMKKYFVNRIEEIDKDVYKNESYIPLKVVNLNRRQRNFQNILPITQAEEFINKEYDKLRVSIEKLYQESKEFKDKFDQIKYDEYITSFSIPEVVNYYKEFIVDIQDEIRNTDNPNLYDSYISLEIRTLGPRLENLLQLLSDEMKADFKKGDLDKIAKKMDSYMEDDYEYQRDIDQLRFNENIRNYDTLRLLHFYYNYFYRRLIEVLPRNKKIIDQLPPYTRKLLSKEIKRIRGK